MFIRKAKQSKFDNEFVIGSFWSGKTNTPIFKIQSKKGNRIATLFNSIEYLRELGTVQAESPETGLNIAMLNLREKESLSIDDGDLKK